MKTKKALGKPFHFDPRVKQRVIKQPARRRARWVVAITLVGWPYNSNGEGEIVTLLMMLDNRRNADEARGYAVRDAMKHHPGKVLKNVALLELARHESP